MIIQSKTLNEGAGVQTVALWARRAKRGECLLYWHGLLMRDRLTNALLNGIAALLWDLSLRGEVSLVQHKSGVNVYDYLAVKN